MASSTPEHLWPAFAQAVLGQLEIGWRITPARGNVINRVKLRQNIDRALTVAQFKKAIMANKPVSTHQARREAEKWLV